MILKARIATPVASIAGAAFFAWFPFKAFHDHHQFSDIWLVACSLWVTSIILLAAGVRALINRNKNTIDATEVRILFNGAEARRGDVIKIGRCFTATFKGTRIDLAGKDAIAIPEHLYPSVSLVKTLRDLGYPAQ